MTVLPLPSHPQQAIVKHRQHERTGIRSHHLSRHCIGYVKNGKKYIYHGDSALEIRKGGIFYLEPGDHHVEDLLDAGKPFEQLSFYYTSDQFTRILSYLSLGYGLNVSNDHACESCRCRRHVAYQGWNTVRQFFGHVDQYIACGAFDHNKTAEGLKMTELLCLIFSNPDCCLKGKILACIDAERENFDEIVHRHIFEDISIEELARRCNRSLTSFKKEFKNHFFDSPHKWFIRQRLMHARLLLVSTAKSIAEIGVECRLPNTSHFIKLFRKEYGITPAGYRCRRSGGRTEEISPG